MGKRESEKREKRETSKRGNKIKTTENERKNWEGKKKKVVRERMRSSAHKKVFYLGRSQKKIQNRNKKKQVSKKI